MIEFDKMQIPSIVVMWISHTILVGLATIGVCVFVRWLRSAHFFMLSTFGGENAKNYYYFYPFFISLFVGVMFRGESDRYYNLKANGHKNMPRLFY